MFICQNAEGFMLICWNAEGVHGEIKVGNPCLEPLPRHDGWKAACGINFKSHIKAWWLSFRRVHLKIVTLLTVKKLG